VRRKWLREPDKDVRDPQGADYSPSCRKERKRASARVAMSKQRIKRGVVPVKGTTTVCQRCECEFIRNGIASKYCETCVPIMILERAREGVRRRLRARGALQMGTILKCKNCPAEFPMDATRACYCPACRILQKAGKLPSLRASISAWRRKRHAEDPAFAMNSRMRSGIRHSLGTAKAGRSWESLVGYTVQDLMRHLEKQFSPGMTWKNRGRWQIDHRTPLASLPSDSPDHPNFKFAWSLPNLQPFWKEDNYEKRAQRYYLL
jgi:hypothetical protein